MVKRGVPSGLLTAFHSAKGKVGAGFKPHESGSLLPAKTSVDSVIKGKESCEQLTETGTLQGQE